MDEIGVKLRTKAAATFLGPPVVSEGAGKLISMFFAWSVCLTVFLFSYIPILNMVARAVLILFLLWFVGTALFGSKRINFSAPITLYILWGFYALLVSLLASDLDIAVRKWVTVFSIGMVSLAAYNAIVWSGAILSWAIAFLVSASLAYVSNYLPIQNFVESEYQSIVYGRFAGTLANANEFGTAMTAAFLIGLLLLAFHSRDTFARIAIVFMGVMGLAVIESGSRTAMLGLAVGVVGFYHCLRRRDIITPFNLAAIGVVIGGIVAVFIYFPLRFERAIGRMKVLFSFLGIGPEVETSSQSIENRFGLASRAIQVSLEHPLGVGLDNFRLYTGAYSHSNYMEVLVSSGFLGLVLYYIGFLIWAKDVFLEPHVSSANSFSRLKLVFYCLAAVAIMDAFNVTYYSKVFWLFIGILTAGVHLLLQREMSGKPYRDKQ